MITTRKAHLVDRMCDAASARESDDQILHFAPRDFVLIGMPYKRPATSMYERRNGNLKFQIVGHPEFGVPYGQDRLIPFWLASAYQAQGCPESRTIVFRATGDILACYGIAPHGSQYQRLRGRIERVFGASYFAHDATPASGLSTNLRRRFREQGQTPRAAVDFLRVERYQLVDRLQLWFHRGSQPNQFTLWQNKITLSEAFARDVRDEAIPVDIQTVRALRTRPAAMDLYVWQAWRSWRLRKENRRAVRVPLRGPRGLIAQLGTEAKRERKAIELIRKAQHIVKAVWPTCPNQLDGERFIVRPGFAMRPGRKLILPGVTNPPTQTALRNPQDAEVHPLLLDRSRD